MNALPAGWALSRLGAIAQARMGKTILSRQLVETGLPVFSASVGEDPWGYTLERDVVFRRGTIVISARGTIGDVKVPDYDEFVSTQTTIALKPQSAVDPHFLAQQLRAYDWPSVTATTAIPMLTIGKLDEICVVVPPLAEQRRIVAKLDALAARTSRARADLDRIPLLAARQKRAVLDAAVRGELTGAWRAQNGVADFPQAPLHKLCASITDGDHQAPPKASSGVPFITISAMNDGKINLRKATRFVPQTYLAALKPTRIARRGDVLFSVTGSFGIPAFVETDEPFVFQRHIAIIKPDINRVTGQYLSFVLASPQVFEQAAAVATGTAQLTVPLSGLRSFIVPAPSLPEQAEIVRRIESAFADIDRLTVEAAAARRLLDRLDQAVLAKAFRGELVPQDPADEPASALLDRIKAERDDAPTARRGRRPKAA